MPRARLSADESGTASLEFVTAGLVLLLPLVYLVLTMSALQGAALAVEGASRQAARVFVEAGNVREANAAAERAVEFALADYGLDTDDVDVSITCRPRAAACLTRRGFVTVTISIVAPLPLFPAVLGTDIPAGVPIDSVATEQVSRFAGSR